MKVRTTKSDSDDPQSGLGRRAAIGLFGVTAVGSALALGVAPAAAARPVRTGRIGPLPQDTLPVGNYGAVGDGVADDGPAIQAAIDAATAAGGGIVYLPTGEYRITRGSGTETIVLKSNVTIRGDGYGSHIFLDPTTAPNNTRYYPVRVGTDTAAVSNVVVDSIRLTINNSVIRANDPSTSNTDSLMGICARHDGGTPPTGSLLLIHSDNIRVSNCYIYDAQIAVGCTKDGGVAGSTAARIAAQFQNWIVEDCVLDTCGNKMVEFGECNGGIIRHNIMTNCLDGPQAIFYSQNILFEGNRIDYSETGINIAAGSNNIDIVNNLVQANANIPKTSAGCGLFLRTEPTLGAAYVLSDVRSIGNTYRDTVSTPKRVFNFGTRTQVTSALYERITFQNDSFEGNVQFSDLQAPTLATVKSVMFEGCRFDADLANAANSTMASSEVAVRNCDLAGSSGYTVSASGWAFQNNRFRSRLTIASASSATVAQGNIVTGGVTDSGTGSVLANNVTV